MRNINTLLVLILGMTIAGKAICQTGFVINHNHTDIHSIPAEWINTAKDNLVVFYAHASHGSQLTSGGMTSIMNYSTENAEKFRYNNSGANGGLHIIEPWFDLSHDEDTWVNITEEYLTNYPEINVVMWAWSGMAGHDIPGYLQKMENLINRYGTGGTLGRNVKFVFMTGNSKDYPSSDNIATFQANKTIREYCLAHNRILFDFNDLECYNPDGQYFGDGDQNGNYVGAKRLDEDCTYRISSSIRGNWGIEWVTANPNTELGRMAADNICTTCAHSQGGNEANSRLHCVLKGRAAWYLWTRLAGWSGSTTVNLVTSITVRGQNNATSITTNKGTLQLYANVSPNTATDTSITWSTSNNQVASISQSGLLTAVGNGTIRATATANDGSRITGYCDVIISNQDTGTAGAGNFYWLEEFTGLNNGTIQDDGETAWTSNRSPGFAGIRSGSFKIEDQGGECVWTSENIDITSAPFIDFSMDVYSSWAMDITGTQQDYFRLFYRLNNGPEILVEEHFGRFRSSIIKQGVVGNSVQLIVRARTTEENEFYTFDNISVVYEPTQKEVEKTKHNHIGNAIESHASVVELYPNPAHDYITINHSAQITSVKIFDIRGNTLISEFINDSAGRIDVSHLKTGMYYILFETEAGLSMQKLLIN